MNATPPPEPAGTPQDNAEAALPERVLATPQLTRFYHWGVRDYGEILALQERLRDARREDATPDVWLAGEHETVITLGVRADETRDVITRGPNGTPVYAIDRGGQATLHNPGQLVIYPIVKTQQGLLAQARLSRTLLATVRNWVRDRYGVELTIPRGRPGLFHGERKVASIGVSIRRRVSMHGIAINLCNDLTPWHMIIACGEPQTRPITLSEILGRRIEPAGMLGEIEEWLRREWKYEAVERVDKP